MPDTQPVLVKLVVNDKGEYAVWPPDRANPAGWADAQSNDDVLEYIKEVWSDMRPVSLRKKIEEWKESQE